MILNLKFSEIHDIYLIHNTYIIYSYLIIHIYFLGYLLKIEEIEEKSYTLAAKEPKIT